MTNERKCRVGARSASVALWLALLAAAPSFAAEDLTKLRGFVDGKPFVDAVGEGGVTVEVSLGGALLSALTKIDPELHALAGGLKSLHAIVLQTEDEARTTKVRSLVESVQERLKRDGWEALATIREEGSVVRILVLNDDEAIQGLVVMVVEEGEVVFANLAGVLDLAAIAAIGEGLDLPGLDKLKSLDREK